MFVAGIVFWTLLVILEIGNVIRLIWNHLPFDFSFWVGSFMLVVYATILVRVRRLRRSARH
jgi:hypothetical protein